MELLYALLKLLSEEQRRQLKQVCDKSTKAELRLLLYILDHTESDSGSIAKKLKLSVTTFNKSQSLAKTFLLQFIRQSIQTPYDEVSILQKLSLQGDMNVALNFYRELERSYETKQLWSLLDALYIEGFRISQISGKPGLIEQVAEKRNENIRRLQKYVSCYGKIMVEMLAVERFEERKELPAKELAKLEGIYKEAVEIGHHVLIHNALNILYNANARYFNAPEKTWAIVEKITKNREQYKAIMNPITFSITKITLINFLSTHDGFGEPEKYVRDFESTVEDGGILARVTFYYALIGYYLANKELNKVEEYLKLLEPVEDTSKFKQYKSIVLAVKSFLEGNLKGFNTHFKAFYLHPTHTQFPDMECVLRIIELIVIRRTKDALLFDSRLQALRVYMSRNLNKTRYAEEYELLNYIAHPEAAKNKQVFKKLKSSYYRNIKLLVGALEEAD